jgi:hypothetical protein
MTLSRLSQHLVRGGHVSNLALSTITWTAELSEVGQDPRVRFNRAPIMRFAADAANRMPDDFNDMEGRHAVVLAS